jgi:hypothetical protein
VEASDCVKPALKSVQQIRIRRCSKYRMIGFRIQMGSKRSYACGSIKVKKLSGGRLLMPYKPRECGSSVV